MNTRTRDLRRTRRLPLALAAVLPLGAAMVALAGPASATVSSDRGSAYGYQLNVSLFGGPVNTRGVGQVTCTAPSTPPGCVPADQAAAAASPSVTLPSGGSAPITATGASTSGFVGPAQIFSSGQVDVSTQGTIGSTGSVTSSTTIANVDRGGSESFGYGPLDTFGSHPKNPTGLTTNVSSTCTASETGVSGSTTITNGQLELDNGYDANDNGNYTDPGDHAPVRVIVPSNPLPNTTYTGHIEVNGSQDFWKYVFNEQVTNPDGSLTVYAGHQYLQGPTAVGDLYFGKSECGVTRTTTTTVTSSVNPSVSGQPVTFTANVARTGGTGTPGGTVQFKVDGVNSGGPVTLAGGTATSAPNSGLSVGAHTVQAVYSGGGAFSTSTGTFTQTVNKAATTTALTSSANPAGLLTNVTFTATVSPVAPGAGTRTGTVQFKKNGANMGSPVAINAAGQASTTVSGATIGLGGTHAMTAVYSGDAKFNGSTSPVLNQTITVP